MFSVVSVILFGGKGSTHVDLTVPMPPLLPRPYDIRHGTSDWPNPPLVTRDLFKLLHLRTPSAQLGTEICWPKHVWLVSASDMHPTGMLSCLLHVSRILHIKRAVTQIPLIGTADVSSNLSPFTRNCLDCF